MTADDLTASLLANEPYVRDGAPFRLVGITGPDAGDFLQRLCTQDVLGLAAGRGAPAAFLDAKGKLQVTCVVFRSPTSFLLEVQEPQEQRLLDLLERYHFTEKLTIERRDPVFCREEVQRVRPAATLCAWREGPVTSVVFERRGVSFQRFYGGVVHVARGSRDPARERVVPTALSGDLAECLRMVAGLVRIGVETEANTLALEADLDDHVSTSKGCYTGQEIVARIHTYGHVNRKLCLLRLAPGEPITAPQPLHEPEDQLPVGRVMHAVPVPGQDARLGVGYLPKDFQAIGTELVLADGAKVQVIGYEPLPA